MSRLIDADALWMDVIHAMDYCDDILEIIEQQPTVEPERRTGKWILEDVHPATYKYCCSECKAHHRARYDFCPTCGAKMEAQND